MQGQQSTFSFVLKKYELLREDGSWSDFYAEIYKPLLGRIYMKHFIIHHSCCSLESENRIFLVGEGKDIPLASCQQRHVCTLHNGGN